MTAVTRNGTALAGIDFASTSAVLSFSGNRQTLQFRVQLLGPQLLALADASAFSVVNRTTADAQAFLARTAVRRRLSSSRFFTLALVNATDSSNQPIAVPASATTQSVASVLPGQLRRL